MGTESKPYSVKTNIADSYATSAHSQPRSREFLGQPCRLYGSNIICAISLIDEVEISNRERALLAQRFETLFSKL